MKRTELLAATLQPGETLGEAFQVLPDDPLFEHCVYPVIPVQEDLSGNTVLIDILRATKLTHITGNIRLSVRAARGQGEVVVISPDGERRIHSLEKELGEVAIAPGSLYYYLNTAEDDTSFAVRDRCEPPFDGQELSMQPLPAVEGFTPGDYLAIWNPRHPGMAGTAGILRLAILEAHDTTAYNAARAEQSKFRGEPPHWHALAQQAGEDDIYPVNISLVEGAVSITPHRLAKGALAGVFPGFPVQPDYEIFKGQ